MTIPHLARLPALAATLVLAGSAAWADTGIKTGDSSLGPVLTDGNGMTLYVFDRDEDGLPACYDQCAANWPPLVAAEGAAAEGEYGLVQRTDGTMQWTYDGKPLYLWINDKAPGDVTGDGVNGVWHVANPTDADEMTVLDEIEACIPALRRYAHALVRNRDAADDLVQDCLERAVAGRARWRGDGPVRAWLFRILLNRFRDGHRGADALRHLVVVDRPREPSGSGGQDERLALREVEEALKRLPSDQRTALLLVALEGMTIEEAAQVLGIPEGTLASRIARARVALRELTGRDGGTPRGRRELAG